MNNNLVIFNRNNIIQFDDNAGGGGYLNSPMATIMLPQVGVGLNYVYQLFITFTAECKLNQLNFIWDPNNDDVDEISIIGYEKYTKKVSGSSLVYIPNNGPDLTYRLLDNKSFLTVDLKKENIGNNIVPLDILFSTDIDSDGMTYQRTLYIFDENFAEIGRIRFFAESVDEDERLKDLCANFGYFLKPEETYIFYDQDPEEPQYNAIKLNEKRKEYLLEGDKLHSHVGSYKAIINAIKFFEYKHMYISEYWTVMDENSPYYKQDIKTDIYDIDNSKYLHYPDYKNFRKINKTALVYHINEASTELDSDLLPYVVDSYDYKLDDIVVKMFGLRDKINESFMPVSSRIIDIIGETLYFAKISVIETDSNNETIQVHAGCGDFTFDTFPNNNIYITDSRIFREFARSIMSYINIQMLHIDAIDNCIKQWNIDLQEGNIPNGTKWMADWFEAYTTKDDGKIFRDGIYNDKKIWTLFDQFRNDFGILDWDDKLTEDIYRLYEACTYDSVVYNMLVRYGYSEFTGGYGNPMRNHISGFYTFAAGGPVKRRYRVLFEENVLLDKIKDIEESVKDLTIKELEDESIEFLERQTENILHMNVKKYDDYYRYTVTDEDIDNLPDYVKAILYEIYFRKFGYKHLFQIADNGDLSFLKYIPDADTNRMTLLKDNQAYTPCSAKIILDFKHIFGDITWDECDAKYDDLDSHRTWNNFSLGEEVTRVTWKVVHCESNNTIIKEGNFDEYNKVLFELPYLGEWDIYLTAEDPFGNKVTKYKLKYVNVIPVNAELTGLYNNILIQPQNEYPTFEAEELVTKICNEHILNAIPYSFMFSDTLKKLRLTIRPYKIKTTKTLFKEYPYDFDEVSAMYDIYPGLYKIHGIPNILPTKPAMFTMLGIHLKLESHDERTGHSEFSYTLDSAPVNGANLEMSHLVITNADGHGVFKISGYATANELVDALNASEDKTIGSYFYSINPVVHEENVKSKVVDDYVIQAVSKYLSKRSEADVYITPFLFVPYFDAEKQTLDGASYINESNGLMCSVEFNANKDQLDQYEINDVITENTLFKIIKSSDLAFRIVYAEDNDQINNSFFGDDPNHLRNISYNILIPILHELTAHNLINDFNITDGNKLKITKSYKKFAMMIDFTQGTPSGPNVMYIHDAITAPRYTWCVFTPRESKIYNKQNIIWDIKKLEVDEDGYSHYESIFTEKEYNEINSFSNRLYLPIIFDEAGTYKICCSFEDAYGNKYSIDKDLVKIYE